MPTRPSPPEPKALDPDPSHRYWRFLPPSWRLALCVLIAGILVAVALDAAQALRPQAISYPTVETYDPYLDDFVVFYAAADLVADGDDPYNLSVLHSREASLTGIPTNDAAVLPFFNPPYFALAFAPLVLIPLEEAAIVWTIIAVLLIGLALGAVWRSGSTDIELPSALVGLAFVISSMPLYQVIVHGQTTGIMMLAWALIWLGLVRGNHPATGAAGLLLLTLKPQLLLIPVLVALLTGRWRAVAIAGGVGGCLAVASFFWLGPESARNYVQLGLDAATWDETNGVSTYGMFGWNAFLRGIVGSGSSDARNLSSTILSVATIAITVWAVVRLQRLGRSPEAFVVMTAGTILASAHFYAHDLLIFSLALGALYRSRTGWPVELFLVIAIAVWTAWYFHLDILAATRTNLVVVLLATALCWGAMMARRLPKSEAATA